MLGELDIEPEVALGKSVGIHATLAKAEVSRELIRASSVTPPDFDRGPTGSTFHKINSEQNPELGTLYKLKINKKYSNQFYL